MKDEVFFFFSSSWIMNLEESLNTLLKSLVTTRDMLDKLSFTCSILMGFLHISRELLFHANGEMETLGEEMIAPSSPGLCEAEIPTRGSAGSVLHVSSPPLSHF